MEEGRRICIRFVITAQMKKLCERHCMLHTSPVLSTLYLLGHHNNVENVAALQLLVFCVSVRIFFFFKSLYEGKANPLSPNPTMQVVWPQEKCIDYVVRQCYCRLTTLSQKTIKGSRGILLTLIFMADFSVFVVWIIRIYPRHGVIAVPHMALKMTRVIYVFKIVSAAKLFNTTFCS